jgi:hypothetical protein
MTAGVMETRDGPVILAQDENGIAPDLVGPVVAAFRDLRLGGYKQPVAREDGIQLGGIQRIIGEEATRQSESGLTRIQ